MRTLADQGRISVETASELTDFVLKESALKPEDLRPRTYEVLLEMWHKRKNIERATEVFEAMRANGKLTDYGYSVYCKCLATSGQLDKAKVLPFLLASFFSPSFFISSILFIGLFCRSSWWIA
jgi:hypothetical protein